MPDVIVFLGPTLAKADARAVLDADYRPPVAQGDVLRALSGQPRAIGIIDGFFENVPSVWHKEILFALSRGVRVFGAASMGALRAAELHSFGMEGVGAIFEAYQDGRLEDDDEVAVTHGPGEIGYPILSEAMVNIRRTLSDARAAGVLSAPARQALERIAKELGYRERTYARLFDLGARADLPQRELAAFKAWLPQGRADQKREDALAMLARMRSALDAGLAPAKVHFPFQHTCMWDRVARTAVSQAGAVQ